VTGISHHTKATSGSPVFRIAAAGIWELRMALRGGTRAFRSHDAGGEMHGGILSIWGDGLRRAFFWGFVRVWHVVLASFFCVEARVFDRRFEKRGISALSIVNLLLA
jgi:hypothetical protein